ncbi:MAG: pectate lyase [Prevotella sp.]|nr:pectate lyase [Prevotella sp.]
MQKRKIVLYTALLATTMAVAQNKVNITATNGSVSSYNTADVTSIAIKGNNVTVSPQNTSFTASRINFTKVAQGAVQIKQANGWQESAYIEWAPLKGATNYKVYIKGGNITEYKKLDDQLVRNYGTFGRADAVGLKAGTYSIKVVPVINDKEDETKASEATALTVTNYDRQGYAHFKRTEGVGAYNNDGTLKTGAIVLYVTKNTAKTVKATLSTGKSTQEFIGLQAILNAYQKNGVSLPPLDIRVIGIVSAGDVDSFGSSSEGLQIKGPQADSPLNITVEGIGNDATIHGFGILVRNSASVEFRNFAVMRQMDDGLSLDTDNSNIWIHNVDVFYGKSGSGDHAKGDGGIDVKADSKFVTIDYCRFWDTGKSSMCGMKSETGPNYITYHHNWFDHSDSRHARVRTMSVHFFNNYYDGVAKYGVGASSSSDVFVEKNYFRGTKYPMIIANQAHDIKPDGTSTLSGENGGIIKAYDNIIAEPQSGSAFTTYADDNTSFDAYVVSSRDEKVPETVKAKVGGHVYNNFDTNPSLIYTYTPDEAKDVPAKVTGFLGAGRIEHGDVQFNFNNSVDDQSAEINTKLASLIDNYKSTLVGIFGDENASSGETGESGGSSETGGTGETGGSTVDQPTGTVVVSFEGKKPSSSIVTVTGNYSTSKGTAKYNNVTYSICVKMESSTSIVVNAAKSYKMTLVFGDTETASAKINGTKVAGTGSTYTQVISGTTTITKANSVNLFAIVLEPQE